MSNDTSDFLVGGGGKAFKFETMGDVCVGIIEACEVSQLTSMEDNTPLTWPDGSLGCPKPGEMYTQMIVPGYRVVLQAGGERYAYHSDQRGRFVVCANGLALPPAQQQMKSPASE